VPFLIALLGCAACALLWLVYPQRFNPSDPWAYSQNAWEISRGLADFLSGAPNHPFSHRLAVTVPVAALYALFGANIWTTNLWPLLCVFSVIAALCAALPSNRERALAVFLCVTCVGVFRQSTALYADVIAMGLLFPGAVVLYRRNGRGAAAGALAPLAFALLVFAAFLAKETAYWILPVWAYALASDLRAGPRGTFWATVRRFHLPALAALLLLGAGYMTFCERVWGHPLARLISVQELTGHHLWSWQNASGYDWFKRLALAPVKLLLAEFGPALLLALVAVRLAPRRHLFWAVYSGSMILLFWFGSTAFTRYEPLPAEPRMLLPAIPGLFVLAAGLAPRLRGAGSSGWLRAAVLASILPFIAYAFTWDFSPDPRERTARIVKAELGNDRRVLLLTADVRSPGHLAFYFGYRLPEGLDIRDIESGVERRATPARAEFDTVLLFANRALSKALLDTYANRNFEPEIAARRLPVVFEDGDARLYGVPDPRALLRALGTP
jgi:hypothetical protein